MYDMIYLSTVTNRKIVTRIKIKKKKNNNLYKISSSLRFDSKLLLIRMCNKNNKNYFKIIWITT